MAKMKLFEKFDRLSLRYFAARQRHIVEGLYSGNDTLPLETKDHILREALGNPQINFESISFYNTGRKEYSPRIGFAAQISILESIFLQHNCNLKPD